MRIGVFILGFSLFVTIPAHAQTRTTWFQDLEIPPEVLEQRATQILKFYDPDGIVWVQVKNQILPARPESRENMIEAVEVITSKKERIKLLVFTSLPKVPPEFLKTLRTAMGATVDISKVIPLPKKLDPSMLAGNPAASQTRAPSSLDPSAKTPDLGTNGIAPMARDAAVSTLDAVLGSRALMVAFLLGALGLFSGIVWLLAKIVSQLKEIPSALREKLNAKGDDEPAPINTSRSQEMKEFERAQASQHSRGFDLDTDAILGLFCDLIHGKKFEELHYYWEQTPFTQKRDILTQLPQHKGTLSRLTQYGMKVSKYHQDPAYLTLTLAELDMSQENVLKKIKVYPEWILKTSALQRDSLALPILEKLGLYENYPDLIADSRMTLSKEDEKALLSRPGVKPFWVTSCVSLVWLKLLGPEVALKILSGYNAMDLAKIWDVAEEFKRDLEKWVPADKLELVHFYADKKGAGRDERLMSHIHEKIVQAFLEKSKQKTAA